QWPVNRGRQRDDWLAVREEMPGREQLLPDDRRLLGRPPGRRAEPRRGRNLVRRHLHYPPRLEVRRRGDGTGVAELHELVRVDLEVEVGGGGERVACAAEESDHLPGLDVPVMEDR